MLQTVSWLQMDADMMSQARAAMEVGGVRGHWLCR